MGQLSRVYNSVVKPRSRFFQPTEDGFCRVGSRIYDSEIGVHRGVSYRIEGVVREERNPFDLDQDPHEILVRHSNLRCTEDGHEYLMEKARMRKDSARKLLQKKTKSGILNNLVTRPSYRSAEPEYYLILNGVKLPDLDAASNANSESIEMRDSFSLHRLLLRAFSEEKFRQEYEAVKTGRGVPSNWLHMVSYGILQQLRREKCGYAGPDDEQYVEEAATRAQHQSDNIDLFAILDKEAVPVLSVRDMNSGHRAAVDCINFYLDYGKLLLEDRLCLVRQRDHVVPALSPFSVAKHFTGCKYLYVETIRGEDNLVFRDLQVAPASGHLDNEELQNLMIGLIPEELRPFSSIEGNTIIFIDMRSTVPPSSRYYKIHFYTSREELEEVKMESKGLIFSDARESPFGDRNEDDEDS